MRDGPFLKPCLLWPEVLLLLPEAYALSNAAPSLCKIRSLSDKGRKENVSSFPKEILKERARSKQSLDEDRVKEQLSSHALALELRWRHLHRALNVHRYRVSTTFSRSIDTILAIP